MLLFLILVNTSTNSISQTKISPDSIIKLIANTSHYWNRHVRDTLNYPYITNLESIYNLIEDPKLKALASKNIGDYYYTIKSYEFSEAYLLNSIELNKKLKNWKGVVESQKSLIATYRKSKKINKLKLVLDSCLELVARKNLKESVLVPVMELAIYYSYDTKNYNEGIIWGQKFKDSIAKYANLTQTNSLINYRKRTETKIINLELAKCYIKTKQNIDSVLPFLNDGFTYFKKDDEFEKLYRICQEYVNYYILINDVKMANEYMQKYFIYSEKRKSQELSRLIELPIYINSTALLKNKLELSKVRNQQLKKTNEIIVIFMTIILILGAIATLYFIAYKKNKLKLTQQIKTMQQQINADLHDNFGSNLAAISTAGTILKELLQQDKYQKDRILYKFMNSIDKRLRALQIDIKDIIWANNDGNNKLFKIRDRLYYLADQFSVLNNFNVTIKDNISKNKETPGLWNRQLILIVKEAMHNAFKHSKATGMNITISQKRNEFTLICEDKGMGFDINKLKRKSGLLNMQKRTSSINCEIAIQSSSKGTTIKLFGKIPN